MNANSSPFSDANSGRERLTDDRFSPEELGALRQALLRMMSDWSEGAYAAGWMRGTEEMLHEQGGVWEILGRTIGWPSGYEHDADFRWMTWAKAGELFAERKRRREESRRG